MDFPANSCINSGDMRKFSTAIFSLTLFASSSFGVFATELQTKSAPETDTKLIPLPVYATSPTEGGTYGFMPVFMEIEKDGPTRHIVAPSITWNDTIHVTGTFRWYYYPAKDESFTLIAGSSSHVNNGMMLQYTNKPLKDYQWTMDAYMRLQRSIFFRFFGIGPETDQGNESSNTRSRLDTYFREGYNFNRYFNVGLKVQLQRDVLERDPIPPLPLTEDKFATTPGAGGASVVSEGVSVRFDTRENGQYSQRGLGSEFFAATAQGLNNSGNFDKIEWDTRILFKELSWIDGAARVYWAYKLGENIPFYYQSALGGSLLLRGFDEDRFVDKGAWELEFEQRIKMFSTHIYNVTTDWRVDPFVTMGQVYGGANMFFKNPQLAAGLGFRAYVHPNVVGRVDIAEGGEGLKFYVELGYPF